MHLVNVLIIDNCTSYLNALVKLFAKNSTSVVHIDGIALDDIAPNTLVVLSGGHALPVA